MLLALNGFICTSHKHYVFHQFFSHDARVLCGARASSLSRLHDCGCKLDIGAVGSEPFAVSSDEDRLAAGVFMTKLQTRRLSGAQRKQLTKVREGGGEEQWGCEKTPLLLEYSTFD
jgi:hypothetical protein